MPIGLYIIPLVVLGIVAVCWFVSYARKEAERERNELNYYELNYEYSIKGSNAVTYQEAKKCLNVLERNYPGDEAISSALSRKIYHEDMKELRDWTETLYKEELKEWKSTADDYLGEFFDYYLGVTQCPFDELEKIQKYRDRCLEYWDLYFSVPVPNNAFRADDYLAKKKQYDRSAMWTRERLVERLDRAVEESLPILQKKRAAASALRKIVAQRGRLPRSALLATSFEDLTEKEIRQSYAYLLKSRRIVETKENGKYIVSLPPKKEKKAAGTPPPA